MNFPNIESVELRESILNEFETNNLNNYNKSIEKQKQDIVQIGQPMLNDYHNPNFNKVDDKQKQNPTQLNETVLNEYDPNNYTKTGTKRKRKKYDTPLAERKIQKIAQIIESHAVKEGCNEKCKKKCITKISEERRLAINKEYWQMTLKEKKVYMFNCTTKNKKSRKTVDNSRREFTMKYYFKDEEDESHEICKKFFLTTLGYNPKCDMMLRNVLKKPDVESVMASESMRGKHTPSTVVNKVPIIQHINSFHPAITHYRAEHIPKRKYLPTDINKRMMHQDYANKCKESAGSYTVYRTTVATLNISVVKYGHEECCICDKFFQHEKNSTHKRDELDETCAECGEYSVHKENSKAALEEYERDTNSAVGRAIYSADLQKVVMLPRNEAIKEIIFLPRIIAFNQSFVPVGKYQKDEKPVAIIWHEGIAGRSKVDIISTFYAFFITHRYEEHIVLWLDNGLTQYKSWELFAFFVFIVNTYDFNFKTLIIKFFEPGHTMAVDAFHQQVETALKKKQKVCDFSDFEDCVQRANSRQVNVINMKCYNFFEWKDFSSQYKLSKCVTKPVLQDMIYLAFTRGMYTMSYKSKFTDNPVMVDFLIAPVMKEGFPAPLQRSMDRGISFERKQTILGQLRPIIPANKLQFWESLSVSNELPLSILDEYDN